MWLALLCVCVVQAKHAAEVAKRAAQVQDRKASAAAAAAAKAAIQQAANEEQAKLRAQVQVSGATRNTQTMYVAQSLAGAKSATRIPVSRVAAVWRGRSPIARGMSANENCTNWCRV